MACDSGADETTDKEKDTQSVAIEQTDTDISGDQAPVLGPTDPVWTWVAFGAGGAAAVAGGILGGVALSKKNDFMDDCQDGNCPQDRKDDRYAISNMALMADILFGVAIAGIGTGLALVLFNRCFDESDADLSLAPAVSQNSAFMAVSGRF
jgi:hypothetical protein